MELGRLTPIIFTLASRNLFHDRIRLIATLVGIVFSVVLFTSGCSWVSSAWSRP